MSKITTFKYDKNSFDEIRNFNFGRNWPVVYLIEDNKEIYIGQTTNVYYRSKQHYEKISRKKLEQIHVVSDDEFNLSATHDIESWLIQYILADGKYELQNGNGGLKNHNYYDRVKYRTKFEIIWNDLMKMDIVKNPLINLRNSDLFKYSPYKSLSDDQLYVAKQIFNSIKDNFNNTFIVSGRPGTGKTILATYLFKYLKEQDETKHMNIGLVVPMTSLRVTLKKVFSKIKGLKSSMIIGPSDVVKSTYDILIIDESHRLQRRKGIMGYQSFDNVNRKLNLDSDGTQLDWIMKSSKHQIFFYDENQSIKPADVRPEDFKKIVSRKYELSSQMRVEAGEEYIKMIDDIFEYKTPKITSFPNYDFQIFDSAHEMINMIKEKDHIHKLSRVVAGYAWPWHTKRGSKSILKHDIEIDGLKLVWNSSAQDWVNSPNAINEVGCIHTVQGYDLNYVGVIIGPEFYFDIENQKFAVDKEKYFDTNGRNSISDPRELERYIINIYKTLLTRGIMGTYIYISDQNLRKYLRSQIDSSGKRKNSTQASVIKSPFSNVFTNVPLFNSVGCGDLMFADSTVQEMIPVKSELMSKGSKYFVLKTSGDSMNLAGINSGDLVLCMKNYHPPVGSNVVALIGDDATIKEYSRENGNVILKPKSNNPRHKSLRFSNNDEVKIQGVVVQVLDKNEIN